MDCVDQDELILSDDSVELWVGGKWLPVSRQELADREMTREKWDTLTTEQKDWFWMSVAVGRMQFEPEVVPPVIESAPPVHRPIDIADSIAKDERAMERIAFALEAIADMYAESQQRVELAKETKLPPPPIF